MKIIEVISQMRKRGGAEVFFASLACFLAKENDVYCVVLHNGLDPSFEKFAQTFEGKLFFCGKRKGIDFKANSKLRKIITGIHPDVVHSHCQCAMSIFLTFGLKKLPFRYYHTMHSIAQKESPFYDRLVKKFLISTHRMCLIAISKSVEETVKTTYGIHCPVIENGIDMERYMPIVPKKLFSGNFICVAGFRAVKNHSLLLHAFSQLEKRGVNFHLTCCGDGDTLSESKQLSKKLAINDRVTFAGQVSDILPYLSANDCLVLSSHYEGSPLSVIEALSAGLPCIAPNVGGIPDILNQANGLLYKKDDLNSLVDALLFFFENGDDYQKFSLSAKTSSENFSMVRCADEYVQLFVGH